YPRIECEALMHYLRIAFWPEPLVFDYGADLPVPPWLTLLAPAAVIVVLIVFSVRALLRRQSFGLPGCAFFLLLAPTSSIVPIAGQPIAENRIYLPLIATTAIAVVAFHHFLGRRADALLVGGVIGLGWLTHARNEDYRSAAAIWNDTAVKRPT